MANLNYEAQFQCSAGNKKAISNSTCMLSISVGQLSHEFEKFLATINAVNEFKECAIFVDDTLQRHTLAVQTNLTADDLYDKALLEGDRWIERNQHIYEALKIPYKIIRWNHWLNHPDFPKNHEIIKASIDGDLAYKTSFDVTIKKFLDRYNRRMPLDSQSYKKAYQLCLVYLIEECAAMCIWVEGGYNFQVYPFRRNTAMKATYNKFIKPYHPTLLMPISIEFKEMIPMQICSTPNNFIEKMINPRLVAAYQ